MNRTQRCLIPCAAAVLLSVPPLRAAAPLSPDTPPTQTFGLTDTKDLIEQGLHAEPAEYLGRKAVRLTRPGEDGAGMVLLKGSQFHDGTIEVDLATKVTAPPGQRAPGFTGIAFRAAPDASHFELFYLRPGNSHAQDQAMRNHSVQYVSEPSFPWQKLRREWPSIYESWANLQPEQWTHVKIDVHGRKARLYLNNSTDPSLTIDGLKGDSLDGAIGLWGYTREESYFSNLKITSDTPEPITNDGEIAGTWTVTCLGDAGSFGGTMKLVREGSTIAGLWSGGLGPDQPVNGTWRDGYVELTVSGTWPELPGSVTATLAGWIDQNSGAGRMKIEGLTDGRWSATRKQ
ncbi:MAG TPA: hypothetical protein VGU25_05920 [Acidobacteriaceae bacterium]|nr:hypothetical protein [Acidobacteriaceae bacterium]